MNLLDVNITGPNSGPKYRTYKNQCPRIVNINFLSILSNSSRKSNHSNQLRGGHSTNAPVSFEAKHSNLVLKFPSCTIPNIISVLRSIFFDYDDVNSLKV